MRSRERKENSRIQVQLEEDGGGSTRQSWVVCGPCSNGSENKKIAVNHNIVIVFSVPIFSVPQMVASHPSPSAKHVNQMSEPAVLF